MLGGQVDAARTLVMEVMPAEWMDPECWDTRRGVQWADCLELTAWVEMLRFDAMYQHWSSQHFAQVGTTIAIVIFEQPGTMAGVLRMIARSPKATCRPAWPLMNHRLEH